MRASAGRFSAMSGAPTDTLATLLADHSATMRPLFGPTEERVAAFSSLSIGMAAIIEPTELTTFYAIDASTERLDSLQSDLLAHDLVDGAYIKPGAEPAAYLNDMAPTPEEAPPATPDYVSRQGYLEAAPGGVEARWAWTQAGGRGNGIRIIDIEGAWRFTHEDLTGNQGGVVGGTMSTDIGWRNHGTAVLGEFSGDLNSFGVAGITSDAVVSAISIFGGPGSAGAINAAAARLGAGDVILIELHRPGPRFAFANRGDQRGYIAVEWWPDDFAAIRNAVNRGIIVVEAGGNGAENLDDPIYQTPAAGFPAGWTNPFRRANRDSGAIVVGAGAPPPGTHGRTHGADRSRLDFSNYGALFDTQGWGREVTTAGYGDLQGGGNEDLWYTDTFSGTSSASPIIVGVAASLQGMARARGHAVLTPAEFRNCLRSTGSPQQDEPGRPAVQRIGTRPNLRQLSTCAFGKGKEIAKDVVKEGKEAFKELKDGRKETKEVRKELVKEGKEAFKELKDGRKEFKELKEFKERPDKQIKEKDKDKDKDKDVFEGGGLGGIRERFAQPTSYRVDNGGATDIESRLAAIESAVQSLVHFIGSELRPDLSSSALGTEAQGLAQGDEQAKLWKDQKDNEGF
ncbi:S8 family serine peptidase [Rhizobium leguminosarum]|nr:S8 family serine peptidase [Rhizobium leguminosarum]